MSMNSYKSFAYDIAVNGFYYNVLSATTLEVTSGENKYEGYVTIPETITYNNKSYNVVAVGEKAFYKCDHLRSIHMGENIQRIGDYAFYGCSSLINYSFSTSNIGKYVFAYCTSLTSANIKLDIIPDGMFMGCTSLTGISLTCKAIGNYAFKGCTSIKGDYKFTNVSFGREAFADCTGISSLSITPSDWTIGGTRVVFKDAFSGCTSLTTVSIKPYAYNSESTLEGIGFGFADCVNLEEIITDNLSNFQSIDGVLYSNGKNNLVFLPPCHSYVFVVPDEVKRISSYAFSTKGKLQRIILGSSKISLVKGVFSYCPDLKEIYCYSKTPSNMEFIKSTEEIKEGWFHENLVGKLKVYVPKGCKSVYENVSPWNNFIIEEFDVTSFNPYVEIGKTEKIDGIMYKITSFTDCEVAHKDDYSGDIIIPETVLIDDKEYKVTSIGKRAFLGCSLLKTIELPNSIIEIGEDAFNQSGIESIKLPHNLRKIGPGSFSWSKLKKIEISEMTERICAHAFRYCSYLDTVIIPNKVTSIGDGAFNRCNLKTVVIGENVNSIGNAAFELSGTIMNIYTLNRTPPVLNVEDNDYHTIFVSDEKSTFNYNSYHSTLWVPESSLDEYKNNYYWGKFVNIQAFDPNTFDLTTLGIKTTTNDEEEVNRYSLDGRKLLAPTKGVNIIKMKDGTVKKVFVK